VATVATTARFLIQNPPISICSGGLFGWTVMPANEQAGRIRIALWIQIARLDLKLVFYSYLRRNKCGENVITN